MKDGWRERKDNRQTRLNDKFASSRGVSMYDRFICGGAVVEHTEDQRCP